MNDLDRELAKSMQIDPSPDFAARVRSRIAAEPAPSRWRLPELVLAAASALAIGVVAARLMLPSSNAPALSPRVLEHRNLIALAPWPSAAPSRSPRNEAPIAHLGGPISDVVVSRSEMLALQRLFSGALVAPPATPVPDELSIPELALDAISLPTILEGDQQ